MKKLIACLFSIVFSFNLIVAQVTHTKIGQTTYDLQTNGATYNSIVKNADGTISVVWTFANNPAASGWSDRGSGYNYFNGSSWINSPTTVSRIENKKTGFPSIVVTPSGGELVAAHDASNGKMTISRRATKGSGAWTQSDINSSLLWNRTAINGTTIHMIAHDDGTAEGQVFYLKSLNSGVTWSSPIEIPGFTINQFPSLFRGDEYALTAKGNTVAIIYSSQLGGVHMAKSIDNGSTWTNYAVDPFPIANYDQYNGISDVNNDGLADTVNVNDGSVNVTIDNSGIAHIFWGKMRILDDDVTNGYSYFPATDGLMYWNENLTQPKQIAKMVDINNNGNINFSDYFIPGWGFGFYKSSLSSFPSSAVDANGFIYVTYSGLVEATSQVNYLGDMLWTGNTYSGKLSRHIYVVYSGDNGLTWSKPFDTNVNNPSFPTKTEAVFPSLASLIDNDLHIVYQRDTVPGFGVASSEDPDNEDLFNDIVYLKVPKSFLPCSPMTVLVNAVKDTCMNSVGVLNLTSALGAVAPYTYEWGASVGTANTFLSTGVSNTAASGMLAGDYKVVISDVRGCKDTLQFTLQNSITPINVSLTQVSQPTNCAALNGAISSNTVGGKLPLTYSWSNSSSTNSSISGLGIGARILTVTDKNTCKGVASIILLPVTNLATFTATVSTTITHCIGSSDGKAEVAVLPAGAYSYTWAPSAQAGVLATGFAAGIYNLYISDGACGKVTTFSISQPTTLVVATLTATNILCNGETNGKLTANASGGTAPYTFVWNAAAGGLIEASNTSSSITGLSNGAGYGVSVTDKYNCAVSTPPQVSISQPSILQISFVGRTIPTLANSSDGVIRVLAMGGTSPYSFYWSRTSLPNGSANGNGPANVFSGTVIINTLKAGYYTVKAIDANGCEATLNYNLFYNNESSDSKLINITTSVGSLTPTFSSNTYNYSVSLPFGTTGIASLTPTLSTTLATIFSTTIATNVAGSSPSNTAKVVVRSSTGNFSTYTVIYNVIGNSANSLLNNLTTSVGTLSPLFTSNVFNYTVLLPAGSTGTASLNPTRADASATITYNNSATNVAGVSPFNIASVVITVQNGTTTSTYSVTYSVAPPSSNDATLSFLATNVGILNPTFVSSITNYSVTLDLGSTGSGTIAGATTNSGATVVSNQPASDVTGSSPTNTATIVVLAADGVTSLTYTVVYSVSTAINEIKTNIVLIFPNPSNGLITINSENDKINKIEISNTLGEIIYSNVKTEATHSIDLSSQPKGIYFVRIDSSAEHSTHKIVLQ